MMNTISEAVAAFGLLMIPVGIAVAVCFWRGVKAEIRERREKHGPDYV